MNKENTAGVRSSQFEAKTIDGGENDKRCVQQSMDSDGDIKEPGPSKLCSKSKKSTLHAKSFSTEDCFDQHSVYHPRYLSNFLTGKINCMGTNGTPQKRESWQTIFNASGIKKRYQTLRSANGTQPNLSYQKPAASRTPLHIPYQPGKLRENDLVTETIELKHSRGQGGNSKKNMSEKTASKVPFFCQTGQKSITIHDVKIVFRAQGICQLQG